MFRDQRESTDKRAALLLEEAGGGCEEVQGTKGYEDRAHGWR